MNEHKSHVTPHRTHRNWFLPRKDHDMDKLGVAVALAFLGVITMLAGGRGEKTVEQNEWQEQPGLLTQFDIRPLSMPSLDLRTAAPAQSMTGLRQELEDPRRGT
jgi:hypothetical protein